VEAARIGRFAAAGRRAAGVVQRRCRARFE